jgi:Alkylmercury lyase
MDEGVLRIRNEVYRSFVESGSAPPPVDVAAALGLGEGQVDDAYRHLHDEHALVLWPGTAAIRMLNPFSAAETPHRVESGGRSWFANCAWDALGIPAALHADGVIRSACADCGAAVDLEVRAGKLVRGAELLVHFVVPARRWWDDIGFT